MEPIRGKDVVMEFYKEGDFRRFVCATNCTFDGDMEVKSVKTIGDGISAQWRGQKTSYTLSVEGIIPMDEPGYVTAFDLLEYWKQMVDIEYRMVFKRRDNSEITMIRGKALVQKPNVSGPNGFAGTVINLLGNGEVLFGLPPTCGAAIVDYSVEQYLGLIWSVKIFTLTTGSVPRYDWRLDGGATNTSLDTGWQVNVGSYGDHVLEIWPVCDNGISGEKLTVPINAGP